MKHKTRDFYCAGPDSGGLRCQRPVHAEGLCRGHYQQRADGRALVPLRRMRPGPMRAPSLADGRPELCWNSPVPDAWFSDHAMERRLAVSVCERCPVRLECLTGAVERGERHGIWGGKRFDDSRRAVRAKWLQGVA